MGCGFYKRLMKSWLQDNDMEIYSILMKERFTRTLKNKIYRYMTSISKNVYANKLDDITDKYNHTYQSTIKMKPIDAKSSTYIDFDKRIIKP